MSLPSTNSSQTDEVTYGGKNASYFLDILPSFMI